MHCYVTVITVKKILQVPYISHAWSKYTEYVMGWNLHSLHLNCLTLSQYLLYTPLNYIQAVTG